MGHYHKTVEKNSYIKLMSNNNIPIVKPINVKEYDFKQSKYDIAPRLPFSQIINRTFRKWRRNSITVNDIRYL